MGKDYEFKGYIEVRHTIVPDEFFDFQMQDLSLAELKVLLYIFRRTFGFKKHQDWISMSQFVDGICKKTGEQLDRGTGLSATSVRRGTDGLLARGYICAQFYCPACKRPVEPDEMEQQARTQTVKGKKRAYSVTVVPKNCPGCSRSLYGQEQRWFSLVMGSGAGRSSDLMRGVAHGELGGSSTVNEGGSSPRTTQDTVYKTQSQDTVDKTPAAGAAENPPGVCLICSGLEEFCECPEHLKYPPTSPHTAPPPPTCPDCHKPRTTTGTNSTGDCCKCTGEAALAEVFGEREEPSSRPAGHWSENAREQSVAVPAQAGGAHSAAEAVVDEMCRYNGLPGIDALSKAQRREWVRLVAKTIDEYEATADQARVAWQGWTVRNGFRDSIDPHYSSWPSEFGALLAGVKAGTITRASLKREQKGGNDGRNRAGASGSGSTQEVSPEEARRLAGLMRGSAERAARAAAGE